MITVTMLFIWAVVMALVVLIGLFAGGWWFIIGALTGVLVLGSLAATSDRVRLWFVDLDDMIDDEGAKDLLERRFGGEVTVNGGATTITLVKS